ncbi:hypothetical protein ACEPPN_004037 [Leptodophora sp. 'Broadleaf-Isolate-01']
MTAIEYPGVDNDISPSALTAIWTGASIAIIVVVVRTFTQAKIVGRVGIDDYLMILSLASALLNTSLITSSIHWGTGRHWYYLSDLERKMAVKYQVLAEVPGIAAPTLARISFSLFVLKFVGPSRAKKWILWSVIWGQIISNLILIIIILAQCEIFSALWDPTVGGRCWSLYAQIYASYVIGAINSLHDLILTFLPLMILRVLNMSLRIRVILATLMGMSIFTFVASIIKTVAIRNFGKRQDFTHNVVSFIIWFTIENYVVIIAASVPSIRPLLLYLKKSNSQTGSCALRTYPGQTTRRSPNGYVSHHNEHVINIPHSGLKSYTQNTAVGLAVGGNKNMADNESEEHILGFQNDSTAGITKTTTVRVTYNEEDGQDLVTGTPESRTQSVLGQHSC